jgi:hypothetical protein
MLIAPARLSSATTGLKNPAAKEVYSLAPDPLQMGKNPNAFDRIADILVRCVKP